MLQDLLTRGLGDCKSRKAVRKRCKPACGTMHRRRTNPSIPVRPAASCKLNLSCGSSNRGCIKLQYNSAFTRMSPTPLRRRGLPRALLPAPAPHPSPANPAGPPPTAEGAPLQQGRRCRWVLHQRVLLLLLGEGGACQLAPRAVAPAA